MIAELKTNPPPVPVDDIAEAIQFLEWLAANNFTLLGVRDYALDGKERDLKPVPESGLGILRGGDMPVLKRGGQAVTVTPQIRAFFNEPKTLIVTKANVKSRVHRRVYLDYIGVKRFDADGNPAGEFRIVGLFTSTAYTRSTRTIPYLRRKADAIVRRAGFDPDSHSGKALINVLESYPRDELFQIDEDTLYQFALAILQLEERPRVRVLARRDRFDRFVSILVFVPRERFDSAVRVAIGEYLAKTYQRPRQRVLSVLPGRPADPHSLHHRPRRRRNAEPGSRHAGGCRRRHRAHLDRRARRSACRRCTSRRKASELFARYGEAFSDGYREAYSPLNAVEDIRVIESLSPDRPIGVDFYHRVWDEKQLRRPENLESRPPDPAVRARARAGEHGLQGRGRADLSRRDRRAGEAGVWFHDMMLERADGGAVDLDETQQRLEACFIVVMRGVAENDGYNALVLAAGLAWRDVALVRTISRFLRQIRVPYSQDYMWATLRKHAALAAKIVELFHARFDPRLSVSMEERSKNEAAIVAEIDQALGAVESLDEDRIVRRFVNAVQSAIRTNYYQIDKDGQPKPQIAIKFESRKLDGMPLPKPLYEIFVYSPRVEGDHLRFGKVARGGIRWSDRPQDFRTEVLGLVKAQQVKNAVIVPVGSKGGFVPKHLPVGGTREAVQAEGVAAYKIFISTLLDITDNIDHEKGLVPPDNVVRHDPDDPYLVVAADKGTATFSDIANGISADHDYWLGDAFASGGSAGYDHKGMGITARGAWESVKRHFREMDVDISKTTFTTVGVGDMSGDVFGNGLLREKTTKLIAAFDHRDIFIDPTPDPEKSFAERARMFALPRSSWQDYDKKLISAGGGIFPRSLKEIALSKEAQKAIGFAKDKATPAEIMNAILKAPVDLLFFGGIGTYIRATTESDEAAGDRANDPIRITGKDVRAKVIGEGANLGMTQRSRIEAALKGVRLNTDAIDNSAGVNTSDVEVNIKIALSLPVRDGRMDLKARNALLAQMTDEVAALVLRNNYLQTLALSLAQRRGLEDFGFQQRLIQTLEQRGELDRSVEYLPDDMEINERFKRSQPFTRPEMSVLLAYAKLTLYSDLLEFLGARRSVSRARARPLFPESPWREVPRRAGKASPSPRDHRDATRELDDQPRRTDAGRADRRSDRRRACSDSRCLCGGQKHLRHAGAQRRDQRARQQDQRRGAAFSLPDRAGSSARSARLVPAERRSLARAGEGRRPLQSRHRCSRQGARLRAAAGGGGGTCCAECGIGQGRRAGGARAPHRRPAGACVGAGHGRDRRPCEPADRGHRRHLFRGARVLPHRPHCQRREEHRRLRLLRSPRSRSRAGHDRRRRAPDHRRDGRDRPDRPRGGGGLGEAAAGGGRAHPRGDQPDRGFGSDAVEIDRGGEPSGRFSTALRFRI